MHLLVLLLFLTSSISLHVSTLDTSWASSTEWRVQGKVNMLLRVDLDEERWYIYNLLSDANVSLADENTGMMDALCQSKLEDEGLETTLQHILWCQSQHIIQFVLVLGQESVLEHSSQQGLSLEKTTWVLLIKSEQLTSTRAHPRQNHLHSP